MDENQPLSEEQMIESIKEQPAGETPPEANQFTFKSYEDLLKHNVKYKANEKDIEEPIEVVLKRASQGYNYAQRMAELKSNEQNWQKQLEEHKSLADKYKDIDEYARQNPGWFDYWNQAYQTKDSFRAGNQPDQSGIDENQLTALLEQKLQPYKTMLEQQQQKIIQEKNAQEDAELDRQIDATRKQFPDIDFEATDPETGKNLMTKVYELMANNRINDFNLAYKVLDHDKIVARQIEKAKADLVKSEQAKRKAGYVDGNPAEKAANKPDLSKLRGSALDDDMMGFLQTLKKKG